MSEVQSPQSEPSVKRRPEYMQISIPGEDLFSPALEIQEEHKKDRFILTQGLGNISWKKEHLG